jgi:hypothetical protein
MRQMRTRRDVVTYFVLVLAVLWPAAECTAVKATKFFFKGKRAKRVRSKPVLYIARPDSNSVEMLPCDSEVIRQAVSESFDSNSADGKLTLVIATHGWFETKPWPKELALAIKGKVDSNSCLCGWFDWRAKSKHLNPTDAAKCGRHKAGPVLGNKIVGLAQNIEHVHLIGHSAGSWVINEAAKVIAKETDASVHLTFLDAYVPAFWKQSALGDLSCNPNTVSWSEHYFTRDLTLMVTETTLSRAHNVDLSDIDPGLPRIKDHEFPRYWYHATVIGEYARGRRYQRKEFFNHVGELEYGFARSLEAGRENWRRSSALKTGNKPVKIKKPKKPLKLPFKLEELFKARPK